MSGDSEQDGNAGRISVEQLDALIERAFAIAPDPKVAARYGYIRELVSESEEAQGLMAAMCSTSAGKPTAVHAGFVAGIIAGILLAEESK